MAACAQDAAAVVDAGGLVNFPVVRHDKVETENASFSPQNLFSEELFQAHVKDARAWVQKCKTTNKNPLDVCGDRGDLFWLLKKHPWLLRE